MKHILLTMLLLLAAATPSHGISQRAKHHGPAVVILAGVHQERTAKISAVRSLIVKGTNAFRKAQGLGAVKANETLNKAAQRFADFMARTKKFGHTADGRLPSERAESQGYRYCIVSENIAYQFRSEGFATEELAKVLVTGWKNSPEHRKNMLDPDVVETGVGVAQDPESGTYFAVQMFGRPKSMGIRFQLVNKSGRTVDYVLSNSEDSSRYTLQPRMIQTHEKCRPTTLEIPRMDIKTRISDGTRYTVGGGSGGELTLTTGGM